jgi:hypothetical protein
LQRDIQSHPRLLQIGLQMPPGHEWISLIEMAGKKCGENMEFVRLLAGANCWPPSGPVNIYRCSTQQIRGNAPTAYPILVIIG